MGAMKVTVRHSTEVESERKRWREREKEREKESERERERKAFSLFRSPAHDRRLALAMQIGGQEDDGKHPAQSCYSCDSYCS